MINDNIISQLLRDLVGNLVRGNFEEIKKKGMMGRLTLEEIEDAIKSYPGTITMPPIESFKKFHKYDYDKSNQDKEGCLVEYELWYDQQESDLTLSVAILQDLQEIHISIEDIHVL